MPIGYQKIVQPRNNAYPGINDIKEGQLSVRQLSGKMYVFTKNNGVLYKTEMHKDVPDTRETPRDLARKNMNLISDPLKSNRFYVQDAGSVNLASNTLYYTLDAEHASRSEANNSTIGVNDYQACVWIAPERCIIRKFKIVFDYRTTALNSALMHHYLMGIKSPPAHLATGTLATEILLTINSQGGAPGHAKPHVYEVEGVKKDGTLEIPKGGALLITHKRDDGSADTIYYNAIITGEWA